MPRIFCLGRGEFRFNSIRVALVLKSKFTMTCQCNSVWKFMNEKLVPGKCILMLHIALLFIIVSLMFYSLTGSL